MSRYTVDCGVEIGFDPPTNIFFGQVFDEDDDVVDEIESPFLYVVTSWANSKGAHVSQEDMDSLLRDAAEPWMPGPLQQAMGFEGRP